MFFSAKNLITYLIALMIATPTNPSMIPSPAPAKYNTLKFNITGNVTRVTFNNPPINLVDANMISDLLVYLISIQPTPNTTTPKVVIFDSANPDFFLGHIDVRNIQLPSTPAKVLATTNYLAITHLLQNITSTIFVAEINGRAFGAGQELMVQMDMRFAGPSALTGSFENGLGLTAGGGGQLFLGPLINKGRALEYLLSAKTFDGPAGAALGLFNEYFSSGEALTAAVNALAQRIGLFPQDGLNTTKSALSFLNPTLDMLSRDVASFYVLDGSTVQQANVEKFLELSGNETSGPFELGLSGDITEIYQ